MKNKSMKRLTLLGGLILSAVMLSGCTANFCSAKDQANIMFPFDKSAVTYTDTKGDTGEKVFDDNDNLFLTYSKDNSETLPEVFKAAEQAKISIPSDDYFIAMDKILLKGEESLNFVGAFERYADLVKTEENRDLTTANATVEDINQAYKKFGYLKFYGNSENPALMDNFTIWTNFLKSDSQLGLEMTPSTDFINIYYRQLNMKIANHRSCIALTTDEYGNYGKDHDKVTIEAKDWGYAWSKGFFEGLLIFPISWLVDTLAFSFGLNGIGQIWAIVLVTMIVRTLMLAVTFNSTLSQQKMTMLQPELAKIQAKYPNSNTNKAQKERLAQEQMALYKRNKVHPFRQILVMFVQFPIFICVWGAMTGAAVLSSDAVLGLYLSDSIWNTLMNVSGFPGNAGWWTALVLFILMAASQFVSMKLPQFLQKRREKKMPKLTKNPAKDSMANQMKWFSYIMLAMVIVMGFTLPAAMGVYWLIGALFSIIQTLITQYIMSKSMNKNNKRKKK